MTPLEKFIERRNSSIFPLPNSNTITMDDFLTVVDPCDQNDPIYGVEFILKIEDKYFPAHAETGNSVSYGDFEIKSEIVVVNDLIFDYDKSLVELKPKANKALVKLVAKVPQFIGNMAASKFKEIKAYAPLTRCRLNGGPIVFAEDIQGSKVSHLAMTKTARNTTVTTVEVQGEIDVLASFNRSLNRYQNKMDEEVKSATYAHGLCAYVGKLQEVPSLINKINDGISGAICCTHCLQHIGPIGVNVQGHIAFAGPEDLFSWIDKKSGERYFDVTTHCCGTLAELVASSALTEVLVKNAKITGLWVDVEFLKNGGPKLERALEKLMERFALYDLQKVIADHLGGKYTKDQILDAISQW